MGRKERDMPEASTTIVYASLGPEDVREAKVRLANLRAGKPLTPDKKRRKDGRESEE